MNIQRVILRILLRRSGPMPLATLWSEVQLDEPEADYTAFKAALTELQVKSQINVIKGEDRSTATITDAGRHRLAE